MEIRLQRKELEIVFSIANHTDDNELDISQIWTPYYVGERSRDKKISGTGLGLAIVDKICKRLDYSNDCILSGHRMKFVVSMPIKE